MQVYNATVEEMTLEEMKSKFLGDLKWEAQGKNFVTMNQLKKAGQKYSFSLYVSDGEKGTAIINSWVDEFLSQQGNIFYFNALS